jgi:hypothetical protein
MKTCKKCNGIDFFKSGGCRPCGNAAARAWAKANPEKARARTRKWAAAHKDSIRAKHVRYYATPEGRAKCFEAARRHVVKKKENI